MALQGVPAISSASTLTLTPSASIYVYNGAGTATWTLPAITGNSGEILVLYNRGNGTVTVQRAGADQIDNYGSLVNSIPLPPNTSMELLNDGTYWLALTSSARLPALDNFAQGTDNSNTGTGTPVSSGTAYTWTHTVGVGNPYGLVAIYSSDDDGGGTTGGPAASGYTTSAVVTFGGVALTQLGYITTGGPTSAGYIWLFGGANIPAGAQTVSVTFTKTGSTFAIYGNSFTYTNVAGPGAFISQISGNNSKLWYDILIPRSSPNPSVVWFGTEIGGPNDIGVSSAQIRQSKYNFNGFGYTAADSRVFGLEPAHTVVSLTSSPVGWGSCGLELFGQLPAGPYLNACSPTTGPGGLAGLNAGGAGTPSTFYHLAAPGAYVLVAVLYEKATGTSLGAVTYGGTPMTQLATQYLNNDSTGASGQLFLYGLSNVSGGQKTVALTYTGGAPQSLWAESVSYYNVHTVGTPATVYGTGASLSQSVSCATDQLIVQVFASENQPITKTDNSSNLFTGQNGVNPGALLINQSPVTNTFTGTQAATPWAGIAVVLS